jgi:hypothetical protein
MYIALRILNPISWKVTKNDPLHWPVSERSNLRMLDPMFTQYLSVNHDEYPFGKGSGTNVCVVRDGQYYAINTDIMLEFDDTSEDIYDMQDIFSDLLSRVAFRTKQFRIARPKYDFMLHGGGFAPLENTYIEITPVKVAITDFLIKTAISNDDFQEVAKDSREKDVYTGIFLSAIDSYFNEDYTNTFLYCGMACEIALGLSCDIDYQRSVEEHKNSIKVRFNIENIPTAKGIVFKDPIYEYLKNASFPVKLRSLLLYSKGKSLFIDEEKLFSTISKIYLTRNKIVHTGNVEEEKNAYSINQKNALEAIYTVAKFLKWLDLDDNFPTPQYVDGELKWILTR